MLAFLHKTNLNNNVLNLTWHILNPICNLTKQDFFFTLEQSFLPLKLVLFNLIITTVYKDST